LLIPYPAAADNHQFFNAKAFADRGAARLLDQKTTTPGELTAQLSDLLQNEAAIAKMKAQLQTLHAPDAAELIAQKIILLMTARGKWIGLPQSAKGPGSETLRHKQALAV